MRSSALSSMRPSRRHRRLGGAARAADDQAGEYGNRRESRPKRAALPANLPRVERRHEPENTNCSCGYQMKRIDEEVSEKLDYTPDVFTVGRQRAPTRALLTVFRLNICIE